ncbi:MAG TPA: hypothetical protein VFN72_00680 [Solirubrobacterales bacterium]|nr:hypothetical protein [Solirubrobacterales bacterium]
MNEPGGRDHNHGWRAGAFVPVLAVAVVVGLTIGLVAVAPSSSGGGVGSALVIGRSPETTTLAPPSAPVSISLHTKKLVWVCLLDQGRRPVINGLNLIADQTVGPYDGRAFTISVGNGSIDLTVNGRALDIPSIAAPLGYRITPQGATRLPPSEQPSCT